MVRGLIRLTQWYYFLSLTLLMGGIGWLSYFYWKSGLMDTNYVSSVYEASEILDDLVKSDFLGKIHHLVQSDQAKDGVKQFAKFEEKLFQVNGTQSLGKSFDDLIESNKEYKKSMLKIISYPEISSIIKVFDSKMDKFREFVMQKQWQSLTRISARIRMKMYDVKDFSYEMVKMYHRSILQDITIMKNITETSPLTHQDKNNIIIRLQSLQVEITMLQNILVDMESYLNHYKQVEKSYGDWLNVIRPEVSLEKINIGQKNRHFVLCLLAILGFILIVLCLGIYVYKENVGTLIAKIEDFSLKVIKDNIVTSKSPLQSNLSHNFRSEIEKINAYVQKRLSYSSIFQSALPFAAILLDSNLKVIWTNTIFCQTFKLENFDFDQKSLSWDYLLRFTNLGDNDPVIESLQNDLAGIYQVLIKVDQASSAAPYEMYISPVSQPNRKSVMIFFYPLSSMQETIKSQGLTLVDPIKRTLDALLRLEFTREFQNHVAHDFDLAGIKDIFQKFTTYNEFVFSQKNGLLSEIDKMENTISDYHKIIMDVTKKNEELKSQLDVFFENLKQIKLSIISMVQLNHNYEDINYDLVDTNRKVIRDMKKVIEAASKLYEKILGQQNGLETLGSIKNEFKVLKGNLQNSNSRLFQSFEQILIFERSETLDRNKLEQSLSKIKTDLKTLERDIHLLEKTMTSFDVHVSKSDMLLQNSSLGINKETIDNFVHGLQTFEGEIENDSFKKSVISQDGQVLEDKIVKQMQMLFEDYRGHVVHQKEIYQILKETAGNKLPGIPSREHEAIMDMEEDSREFQV